MKRPFTILLVFSVVLTVRHSLARDVHAFVAAGSLYKLSSVRVGIDEWEFGQLARGMYGGNKLFRHGALYSSLGFGAINVAGYSLAMFAAIGYDFKMLWGLGLRGEIFAIQSVNPTSQGGINLGLSFAF